jgi:hypothetical protein
MPKRIALQDKLTIDAVDLSDFSRSVATVSSHAQIDVSGFNPAGSNEYLAGATTQSVTVEFYGSYGTGEVHATLEPLHVNRTVTSFEWQPLGTVPVGPTAPALKGNVMIYDYGPGATRGAEDAFQVTFMPADAAGLAWVTA